MNGSPQAGAGAAEVHSRGPWPFVTLRHFRLREGKFIWRARQHRKGLVRVPGQTSSPFWHRPAYNWWTGLSFAVGASLFMLGALLSLAAAPMAPAHINLVFFAGSIPFTMAGYLQHFQAANTPEYAGTSDTPSRGRALHWIGWQPRNAGWWCTLAQFIGTIAFNVNTFDAIRPPSGWLAEDLEIWVPGMIGSVLFLVSGYLAFIETGHSYWSCRPAQLDWWIVFINLIGCIAFMTASTLAYVPAGGEPGWIAALSNTHLLLGAACFLTGAVLLMIEASLDWEKAAYDGAFK